MKNKESTYLLSGLTSYLFLDDDETELFNQINSVINNIPIDGDGWVDVHKVGDRLKGKRLFFSMPCDDYATAKKAYDFLVDHYGIDKVTLDSRR